MTNEYGPYRDAYGDDVEWAQRAGCVRIAPGTLSNHPTNPDLLVCSGLYIHSNSAHVNIGLVEVGIQKSNGWIRLVTDGAKNGVPIITGDENAAANRLLFGGSGGNGHVNILVSNENGVLNLTNQSHYNAIAASGLNLWVAFHSPTARTQGQPSRVEKLETALVEVLDRISALESGPHAT